MRRKADEQVRKAIDATSYRNVISGQFYLCLAVIMSLKHRYPNCTLGRPDPAVVNLAEVLSRSGGGDFTDGRQDADERSAGDTIAMGSYSSIAVSDHIHFFSADLNISEVFECHADMPAGLWVGALFSGIWQADFGRMAFTFQPDGRPRLLAVGQPTAYCDRAVAPGRIRMASYLVGSEFLSQNVGNDPEDPLFLLSQAIGPGLRELELKHTAPVSDALLRLLNTPYQGDIARLFIESTVTASLFELAQILGQEDGAGRTPSQQALLAREARHLIDSELLSGSASIAGLAARLGTNETTLQRSFKASTGRTIFQYVLDRRMQAARLLVRDRQKRISEIAYAVGYRSPANFSTAYRRHYGVAPAEDRG